MAGWHCHVPTDNPLGGSETTYGAAEGPGPPTAWRQVERRTTTAIYGSALFTKGTNAPEEPAPAPAPAPASVPMLPAPAPAPAP
jgi:hypothetical protein